MINRRPCLLCTPVSRVELLRSSVCCLFVRSIINQSINQSIIFFNVTKIKKCYYEVNGSVVDWNSLLWQHVKTSGKDWWNRCVFRRWQNIDKEADDWMSGGREFQGIDAATGNWLSITQHEGWLSPTERAPVSAISLRHILASPGYAPETIAVNVTCMKRGFNACQTHCCMYLSIFDRFPVI